MELETSISIETTPSSVHLLTAIRDPTGTIPESLSMSQAILFCFILVILLSETAGSFVILSTRSFFSQMTIHRSDRSWSSLEVSANTKQSDTYHHVKAVIFDVDGTLADSWKLGFDTTAVILDKHQISPISEELYHECTKYATPERLARHAGFVPGDADFESTGTRLAQEFDDLYVGLVTTDTAGFYAGISALLDGIPSHVALGALTNAAVRYAHAVLETNDQQQHELSLYTRFRSIRGADNVPAPKPSPAGLLQVCRDLNLLPEDCVYIGDSPSDGVAAKGAGMPAIGVLWGSHQEESLQQAPFTHLCRTVEELQALLPRIPST
jgi:phosphoglycolate phosphatase-like HAD superfamily hydrolase